MSERGHMTERGRGTQPTNQVRRGCITMTTGESRPNCSQSTPSRLARVAHM